jgi:hypothetical protein
MQDSWNSTGIMSATQGSRESGEVGGRSYFRGFVLPGNRYTETYHAQAGAGLVAKVQV